MVQCRSMVNVFDPSAGRLPELLTSDLCRKKNALPFNQTFRHFFFFQPASRDGNSFENSPFQTMNVRLVEKILLWNLLLLFFFFYSPPFPLSLPHLSALILSLKGCILIIWCTTLFTTHQLTFQLTVVNSLGQRRDIGERLNYLR